MSDVAPNSNDTENDEEVAVAEGAGTSNRRESTFTVKKGEPRGPVCLVCNLVSFGPPGTVWVQPCRCGYWVHDQCLVDVTMIYEDYNPGTRTLGCRICRRTYDISPMKSYFQKYVEKCSDVWYQNFCYVAMETFSVLISDVVFIKLGVLVLRKMYGTLYVEHLVSSMTPGRAILMCQMIPVTCIMVYSIPWEHTLLKLLRKCSSLPLVGGVFPSEDREIPDIYEGHSDFTKNMIGGVLLPIFAAVTSRLFNGCVQDPFIRLLLGGATFVTLKGICTMYYKQKKYARYCTLTVMDFITANE